MRRSTLAAAVFAFSATILAGCGGADGGGDADAYCAALKDLGGGSYIPNTANSETVPKLRKIAEVSPPGIKEDWLEFADWQEKAMAAADSGSLPSGQFDTSVLERITAYNQETCMK